MTKTPPLVKAEEVPEPTGIAAVWHHLCNWAEGYLWLPLSLLAVWSSANLYIYIVGAPVMENPIWLVGYSEKLVQLILLLLVATITKQQTGGAWLCKDEKISLMRTHQGYAVTESLKIPFYLTLAAYILLH